MNTCEAPQGVAGDGIHGWEQVNPKTAVAVCFYASRYTMAFQGSLRAQRRTILKDQPPDETRRYRYCRRSQPGVTFRKEAHAVPEFLGNRSIFTSNECDQCNQWLAHSVEDHLAKWFGPIRTVCQMAGKRGFPKYKAPDGSARVERGEKGLHLELKTWDAVKTDMRDLEEVTSMDLPFSMPTERFIPVAAAKCLIKVACCLAPPEDLPYLKDTIAWVTCKEHGACPLQIDPMPVLYSFTPVLMPYGGGRAFLMRRQEGIQGVPYLVVAIASANHLFTTFVPFCAKDGRSQNKFSVNLCCFPVPFPAETAYGGTGYYLLNWSSTEPEVDHRDFKMHLQRATRIEPDEAP